MMGNGKGKEDKEDLVRQLEDAETTEDEIKEKTDKDSPGVAVGKLPLDAGLLDAVKTTLDDLNKKLDSVQKGIRVGENVDADEVQSKVDIEKDDHPEEEAKREAQKFENSCLLLFDQSVAIDDGRIGSPKRSRMKRNNTHKSTRGLEDLTAETRRHAVQTTELMKCLIYPSSRAIVVWDAWILLLVGFLLLYVPFNIGITAGFHTNANGSYLFLVSTFVNLFFVVDIV